MEKTSARKRFYIRLRPLPIFRGAFIVCPASFFCDTVIFRSTRVWVGNVLSQGGAFERFGSPGFPARHISHFCMIPSNPNWGTSDKFPAIPE